jgi:hypothetical protein
MTKILQHAEFRTTESPKSTPKNTCDWSGTISEETRKAEQYDKQIQSLEKRVEEMGKYLEQVLASKTWKLGQLYGKFFGAEAKWRKNIRQLYSKNQ